MNEDKSLLSVFIISTVLAILFSFAYKASIAHQTDFWMELLYLIGNIIKVILIILGTIACAFLIYLAWESPARSIKAFFVLMNEKASWCDDVDAFKEKYDKESREHESNIAENKRDIKTLSSNDNILYKNIKEIREFIGIDAQKAQAEAEKAIEESVQ